jgi:hypothetical protein
MLSAAHRQRKLAKRAKVRKEMASIAKLEMIRAASAGRAADRRGPDDWLLILDKREELFGQGNSEGGYTAEQIDEVNAIIDGYTPEQRKIAIELAKALRWDEPEDYDSDVDHSQLRQQQRRVQGRGI